MNTPNRGGYTVSCNSYGGFHYAYINGEEACSSSLMVAILWALIKAVKIKIKMKLKIKYRSSQ